MRETFWLEDATILDRLGQLPSMDHKNNAWRIYCLLKGGVVTACAQCAFMDRTDLVLAAQAPYLVRVLDTRAVKAGFRAIPKYEEHHGLYSFPGKPAQRVLVTEDEGDHLHEPLNWHQMATGTELPMIKKQVEWLAEDIQGQRHFWCSRDCRHAWLSVRIAQLGSKDPNYKVRRVGFTENGPEYNLTSKRGVFVNLAKA